MHNYDYKTYIINDKSDCLEGELIVGNEPNGLAVKSFLRSECIESCWYTRVPKKSKVTELTTYYVFKYYRNKNSEEFYRLIGFLKKYNSIPYKDMKKLDDYYEKLKLAEKLKQ